MMKNLACRNAGVAYIRWVSYASQAAIGSQRKSASIKEAATASAPRRAAGSTLHGIINIDRQAAHHRCYEVVDGEYPAAPVLSIRRLFIEIPRRPLPPREGAAFVAIKAHELCGNRLDPLLQPKRLAVLI